MDSSLILSLVIFLLTAMTTSDLLLLLSPEQPCLLCHMDKSRLMQGAPRIHPQLQTYVLHCSALPIWCNRKATPCL